MLHQQKHIYDYCENIDKSQVLWQDKCMKKNLQTVAIDGPAGVGKSTAARLLAQKLGWSTLETGAIYRAITATLISKNVQLSNQKDIALNSKNLQVEVQFVEGKQHTLVDGVDLTPYLRIEVVEKNVAIVSKVPFVRQVVRTVQRQIAENHFVVVEGRDIGTVVLPECQNKFFLTASASVRAKRRFDELKQKGQPQSFEDILTEIQNRDTLDTQRVASPLVPANDAKIIDTSLLAIEEVVEIMYRHVKNQEKNIEK